LESPGELGVSAEVAGGTVMRTPVLPILLLAWAAPSAAAQTSAGDARAFDALRASHIGALTPLMSPPMINRRLNGAQLAIRYALRDERGVRTHSVAGSGIFSLGLKSSLGITAGVTDGDCVDCAPALLIGIGGDMRIYEIGDFGGPGSNLSVSVSGDFGYAQIKPGDDHAFAFGIGAPLSMSFAAGGREGLHFVPYFTPIFGIGQRDISCPVNTDCQLSGTRLVMGGGIGVWNPMTSISASVGVNHVVLAGALPVFGVNVMIGGR
jgi:hypothetical protein